MPKRKAKIKKRKSAVPKKRKSVPVFVSIFQPENEAIHKINLREESSNTFFANLISESIKQSRAQNYLSQTPVPRPVAKFANLEAPFKASGNNQKTPLSAMPFGAEAGGIEPHPSYGTVRVLSDGQSHLASASHDLRNSIISKNKKIAPPIKKMPLLVLNGM